MNEFDVRHPLRELFPPPFDDCNERDGWFTADDELFFKAADYFELALRLHKQRFVKPNDKRIFELLYHPDHEFDSPELLKPEGEREPWSTMRDRRLAEARADGADDDEIEWMETFIFPPVRETAFGPRHDQTSEDVSRLAMIPISTITRATIKALYSDPNTLMGRECPEDAFDVLAEGSAFWFLQAFPMALCRVVGRTSHASGVPFSDRTVLRWLDVLERLALAADEDEDDVPPGFRSAAALFYRLRPESTALAIQRMASLANATSSPRCREFLESKIVELREYKEFDETAITDRVILPNIITSDTWRLTRGPRQIDQFDGEHPLRALFPPPFDDCSREGGEALTTDELWFQAAHYCELAWKLIFEEFVWPDWDRIFELLYHPMDEFNWSESLKPDGTLETWLEAHNRKLAEARAIDDREGLEYLLRFPEVPPMRETPSGLRSDETYSDVARLTTIPISQVNRATIHERTSDLDTRMGQECPDDAFGVLSIGHAYWFLRTLPSTLCRAVERKPLSERTVVRWLDLLEWLALSTDDDNEKLMRPLFELVDRIFHPVRSEHTHVIVPRLVDMAQRTMSQVFHESLEFRVRDYREHLDGDDGFL